MLFEIGIALIYCIRIVRKFEITEFKDCQEFLSLTALQVHSIKGFVKSKTQVSFLPTIFGMTAWRLLPMVRIIKCSSNTIQKGKISRKRKAFTGIIFLSILCTSCRLLSDWKARLSKVNCIITCSVSKIVSSLITSIITSVL